jgi:hypothetical protein
MMVPMAGKRPWAVGAFAATAVAALALFAGRAGVPAVAVGTTPSRVIFSVAHHPVTHALIARPDWLRDPGAPGSLPAATAVLVASLMLGTVPLCRTRLASAASGSPQRVRGPPEAAVRSHTAGR